MKEKTMNRADEMVTARIVNGFVPLAEGEAGFPQGDGGRNVASGGNPAGVVLDADGLSEGDMQAIAGRVGLSETAFVSRSETEGFKLDFFTPNRRIAHCGHATIAAFSYLAELGWIGDGETSKETVDGPRKIVIKNRAAYMEQLAPRYEEAGEWADRGVGADDVRASMGLAQTDLDPRLDPVLVNTGNSFVIVAVRDAATLKSIKPDFEAIEAISEKLDLIGFYVFATDEASAGADATTRMFAPRYAIEEEAATGMAAGPLACVLHDKLSIRRPLLTIAQGHFMEPASPSVIKVELLRDGETITGLMAGGYGKVMKEMTVPVQV
jgi:PhzF family phenazine biosynthesis protein